MLAYFSAFGLDFSDVMTLFTLLDRNSDGCINRDEFLRGCLRLQGEAKSFDLATLNLRVEWLMHNLSSMCETVVDMSAKFGDNSQSSLKSPRGDEQEQGPRLFPPAHQRRQLRIQGKSLGSSFDTEPDSSPSPGLFARSTSPESLSDRWANFSRSPLFTAALGSSRLPAAGLRASQEGRFSRR